MKDLVLKIGFFLLGKGLEAASLQDDEIKRDLKWLPEGYTFLLKVYPGMPLMLVKKAGEQFCYLGQREADSDLQLVIKNRSSAFRLVTTQVSIAGCYAQNRFQLIGDASEAMLVVRCLHRTEYYLFPSILSRRIFKRQPAGGFKKQLKRMKIYLYILFKRGGRKYAA